MAGRAHYIAHVPPPQSADALLGDWSSDEVTWVVIEATIAPSTPAAGWTPYDLHLVAGADKKVTQGIVGLAKYWCADGCWALWGGEELVGEQRVRLLAAIRHDAVDEISLLLASQPVVRVDMRRAWPLAEDKPDGAREVRGPDVLGDCNLCGTLALLGAGGRCARCQRSGICRWHPTARVADRCPKCRTMACAACLVDGPCPACRDARKAEPEERAPRHREAAVRRLANSKGGRAAKRLVPLAILLVALRGGVYAYMTYATAHALTPEQRRAQALIVVADAVEALKSRDGKLPGDPEAINQYLEEKGVGEVPKVVPGDSPPVPRVVVYKLLEDGFKLMATDESGRRIDEHGEPIPKDKW